MAENSPIEWTDHTWSPWEGCTKVSPGCDHCYAESMNRWLRKGANWGPGAPRREYSDAHWRKPLRWNAAAAKAGTRLKVFPSVCDPFDNAVPPPWRAKFFALIQQTPNLDWLLLTKRIGNAATMMEAPGMQKDVLPNVWLGATVVNQEEADRDIPKLLATPARVRFLSIEPMLGPVDLSRWLRIGRCQSRGGGTPGAPLRCGLPAGHDDEHSALIETGAPWFGLGGELHQVIAGGESGHGARPMHPDWARSLRDQCAAAGVAFLWKQWGEWMPISQQGNGDGPGCSDYPGYANAQRCVLQLDGEVREAWPAGAMLMRRIGKKAAGRLLDGVAHDGMPTP